MSALGRGDWVKAISDDNDHLHLIKTGDILQISDAYPPGSGYETCHECHKDVGRLKFYGVYPPDDPPYDPEGAWCPCGFVPIEPPGKTFISDLMKLPAMQPRRRVCEPA